jgi:AAA family ATP:ADP antiporter
MPIAIPRVVATAINAEPEELSASFTGFALFFCIFSGYFMLRPVREAMGIAAGIDQLQWLFTTTFLATLLVVPLFAWLSSRVPRRQFASWVYAVFCLHLGAFALAFHAGGESIWTARVFYVWISVYNLFVVSVTWSVMADVFDARQARRLFAFIAAGASVGGLAGPAAGALLVGTLGHAGLVLVAGLLLGVALVLKAALMRWRELGGAGRPGAVPAESTRRPVAGNPLDGMTRVFRSPYLLAIAAFVVLLASVTTFLYFEQARMVAALFPDRDDQIRVFSVIDMVVQAGALLAQAFVTGRVAQKLGVRVLLARIRDACGADDRAPHRRTCLRAAGAGDAVRAAGCAHQVQGQGLYRHRGVSRGRCRQRLAQECARPVGAGRGRDGACGRGLRAGVGCAGLVSRWPGRCSAAGQPSTRTPAGRR